MRKRATILMRRCVTVLPACGDLGRPYTVWCVTNLRTQEGYVNPMLHRAPEAAKRSGLGLTTIKALIKSGELPSIKIGRARFVPDEEIVKYVQRKVAEQNEPQVA